jgi:hypothetical protein
LYSVFRRTSARVKGFDEIESGETGK